MEQSDSIPVVLESGEAPFMGESFFVERGVLVPRAVTEVLIRACRELFQGSQPRLFVDLGCGAGIIGIMLARAFPEAHVIALDISSDAVRLTQRNVDRHGLTSRFEVKQSDMFAQIEDRHGQVDAIVSSPPFISSGRLEKASAHLLEHEPRAAFDAGPYGISIHQRLIKEGSPLLRPETGHLVVEFGEGQDKQVRRLLERSEMFQDLREFKEMHDQFVACIAAKKKPA